MIFLILCGCFIAAILIIVLYVRLAPQFGGRVSTTKLQNQAVQSCYSDGKFFNQTDSLLHRPPWKAMKEFWTNRAAREPKSPLPVIQPDTIHLHHPIPQGVAVTWLGHSSVLIEMDGRLILTDPMFGDRASPFSLIGPKRFNDTLPLPPDRIPHLDVIIISHDHYDHLDYGTIRALHAKTDRFFVPLGVSAHLKRWGVAAEKIFEVDWWKEIWWDNLLFVATPTRHFSGRQMSDRNSTLWSSWVLKSPSHTVYFGADSGYGLHFSQIGDRYGPFDLTMLECAAYSVYWPTVHMVPEQTTTAHIDLNGKILLPIHWAQFNLSLHQWKEPIERLVKNVRSKNIRLATPRIGERFQLDIDTPDSYWWEMLD